MAAAGSTVRVTFLGDSASLSRAANTARGELDKAGKSVGGFKKILGGLAIAGGVAGAFSFAKGLAADAAESAKVTRLTEAAIKSTGGAANVTAAQVGKLSTAISNKTGADDDAIQSGSNLLLTFTNVRNAAGKGNDIFNQSTQAVTDMTAALNNGDVSAEKIKGSSIQLGKALNDPIKGITALSKAGVSFTEGQKKQIKALVASGDTMGAQKIILGELNKEFGGAAAAASDPAQKAAVAWGNLREQLGSYLLPIINKVATFLSGTLIPAISKFFDNVKNGGGAFAAVRNGISQFSGFLSGTVLPLVQRFGAWFLSVGWPAIQRFAAAFWTNLQPALRAVATAIQTQLRPALESALAKFREAWPTIQRVLTILGQVAGFILSRVVPVLIQLYSKYLATVIRVFAQVFAIGWKVIGALVSLGAAVGRAGAAFGRFVAAVSGAIGRAWSAVKTGIGNVVTTIGGLPGKALSAVGKLGSTLKNVGIDLIQGFINGIIAKAGSIGSTIKSFVTDKIPGFIKGPLGISSPSKLTRGYGEAVSQGMADGIKAKAAKVAEQTQAMVDKLKEKLTAIKDFVKSIREAFVASGDVSGFDTSGEAGSILDQLKKKADQAVAFAKGITALRKAGLNETSIGQLRDAGPDTGAAAVQQLLTGGNIGAVNALMKQIQAAGATLGSSEAKAKFGIDPANNIKSLSQREVRVILDVRGDDPDLIKRIRKQIRVQGGNAQMVLGS